MKTTLLLASLLSVLVMNPALARERGAGRDHHPRQNFTQDSTRITPDGRQFKRHTEQTVTDQGFRRETSVTNPEGQTANRVVTQNRDPATGTVTRTIEGNTFNGKTFSKTMNTQKTDDGFNRDITIKTPEGKTIHKEVEAKIDPNTGTVTKQIKTTGPDGEVHEKTVTHQRQVTRP